MNLHMDGENAGQAGLAAAGQSLKRQFADMGSRAGGVAEQGRESCANIVRQQGALS